MSSHLDSTGAAVESGGRPCYPAVTVNLNVDLKGNVEHAVITANRHTKETFTAFTSFVTFI